jgi:hypothetical protein
VAPNGHYAYDNNYFAGDVVAGPLRAEAVVNGVYSTSTPPSFPTNVYNATSYAVTPIFVAISGTDELGIFGDVTPPTVDTYDTGGVNLGTKFFATQDGYVQGVRFYKDSSNTGTHIGTLWSSSGTQLATGTFSGETASGWQTLRFSVPVEITKDTAYVVSYFAPNAHYSYQSHYFDTTHHVGPLVALNTTDAGGNGLYSYGSSNGFPTSTYGGNSYFVDPIFTLGAGDEGDFGDLQFRLTWSGNSDVDLRVTEPNDTLDYYGNPGTSSTGAVFSGEHACPGAGSHDEVVTWNSLPPSGDYAIAVDQYDTCGGTSAAWSLQVIKDGAAVQANTGTGSTSADIPYVGS